MRNKKILIITTLAVLTFLMVSPAQAVSPSPRTPPSALKEKLQQKIEEIRENLGISGRGILETISTNTLSVNGFQGKNITVNVTPDTKLRRRFGTSAALSEFSVGDNLFIVGKWTDQTKNTLNAKNIRDLSIQKIKGTFFGSVQSIDTAQNKLVVSTAHRGNQTVSLTSATKIQNRKGEVMGLMDIQPGDKVRVHGLWDRTLNTVQQTEQLKDFSFPPIPTHKP